MNGLNKKDIEALASYKGCLHHSYSFDVKLDDNGNAMHNENGVVIKNSDVPILNIHDTRDLEMEKLKYIKSLWETFNDLTLDTIPSHVQANGALGLLPDEEMTHIKNVIAAIRNEYKGRKDKIGACNNCDDIAPIVEQKFSDNLMTALNDIQNFYIK